MKQKLEQVISELEAKQLEADHYYDSSRDTDVRNYHDGKGDGIELALQMLREVIDSDENGHTDDADGHSENHSWNDTANQVVQAE